MTKKEEQTHRTGLEIAVIGIAGKFPGADNLEQYWENLKNSVETISVFTDEELRQVGIDPVLLQKPNYVKAKGYIEGIEEFDPGFFGYSPREAEIMDPQIRLLQECSWQALEDAGYDPKSYEGLIGLYVGAASNYEWVAQSPLMKNDGGAALHEAGTLCYKDAISTLTSYKLGLKGPSFTMYTACSTSLLSIHLACRALLTGECTIALAGGVRVSYPNKKGYLYEPGLTSSPDGHVRAFDADAKGAVFSDGVGMVVLKRLEDAIADNDNIAAVIKGTAANNDGARKVGYTAPSVEGQAEVIMAAQHLAEVESESISYIETHGTATNLGDTIEFEALKRAFPTEQKSFCGIGSVKSNIGHLDTAAGVAGFLKTVLALKHKQLPPTLHFNRPNPRINLVNSPFYVVKDLQSWEHEGYPLRAGVSAFGYGGTNVHVILEEAPTTESEPSQSNQYIFPLSARSLTALDNATNQLVEYLCNQQKTEVADVAYTLQIGRREFPYRRAIVATNSEEAIAQLLASKGNAELAKDHQCEVIFLFHRHGFSDGNLLLELYSSEPMFKNALDRCFNQVQFITGYDLRNVLYPQYTLDDIARVLKQPEISELLSFVLQYGLASLFIARGVKPTGMSGFGIGEYVSAVVGEVMTLEEALSLVIARGKVLYSQTATVEDFQRLTQTISLQSPRLPFISSVTGTWITNQQASDFGYWVQHLYEQVEEAVGLEEVAKTADVLFLQLFASDEQRTCLAKCIDDKVERIVTVMNQEDVNSSVSQFLQSLGTLWTLGKTPEWKSFYDKEKRRRVSLPTYPFEKQRYWPDSPTPQTVLQKTEKIQKNKNIAEWFYLPTWESAPFSMQQEKKEMKKYLIFVDEENVGSKLANRLSKAGHQVSTVGSGTAFSKKSEGEYVIQASEENDYKQLFQELRTNDNLPDEIIHMWNVNKDDIGITSMELGYYSLIHLVKAISEQNMIDPLQISVITNHMQKVGDTDRVQPEKAMLLAPVKVIPQEFQNIRCRSIDIAGTDEQSLSEVIEPLFMELTSKVVDTVIAYRNQERYVRTFDQVPVEQLEATLSVSNEETVPQLRKKGVYLITGGLGGIGTKVAEYLAKTVQAKLILLGRSQLPQRAEWETWLANHEENDDMSIKIRHIQQMEEYGAEVLIIRANVADENQMRDVIAQAEEKFGSIHGVIHAAGILRVKSAQCMMEKITKKECEEQFQPKLYGTLTLEKVLRDKPLDFCLLVSSLSPILGGLGFVAYAAANLYLDAFAEKQSVLNPNRWISVNWGDWQYTGKEYNKTFVSESIEILEMTPKEGIKTFQCVLGLGGIHQVIISSGNLYSRINQWIKLEALQEERASESVKDKASKQQKRSQYMKNRTRITEIEQLISEIWMDFYRVDSVNPAENFFQLGATSLDIIQIHNKIVKSLEKHIPIEVMFEFPTIHLLAKHLSGGEAAEAVEEILTGSKNRTRKMSGDIAVIGMAGRFPGAKDIDTFWGNLRNGVESVVFFTDEELKEAGVDPAQYSLPNYVKAKGYLEGTEYFDSAFFDYTPKDAMVMDPQLRVFHECTWAALEHAGYNIDSYKGLVGVFAGASPNLYWQVMATLAEANEPSGQFLASLLNDKDSLSTQISYKLNLKGPSSNIFTGCSTSLVSIITACQALLNGQCDMAIAGGITLTQPDKAGYIYEEGMLFAVDGHCRSFDEKASGMLFGDGAGVVVLKSLEDAITDGDFIHAVIKGSAINNDGNRKVGYTAPSVEGQVDVIRAAHSSANVDPESITYIETHGTATKLGDTIEISALKQAFNSEKRQYCAIGSVKSNVGHLNAASGVAGFIKVVMAMQNRQIPASLHFKTPNKQIDFDNSPFFVNTQLREWKSESDPLRAGVSSFGIGGTNAHIVLEEASPRSISNDSLRDWKMLVLSAKTVSSLDRMTQNLGNYLRKHPDVNLADVSYTLQLGRKSFTYRRTLLCKSVEEASELLLSTDTNKIDTIKAKGENRPVVFMFSGQGSQYVNMGRDLYEQEPQFRAEVDKCFTILEPMLGFDLRNVLFPEADDDEAGTKINKNEFGQPILFTFEYALAQLLMQWGIQPSAVIGYSFGEYVAATIAGVFSLHNVLKLIVERGRLMNKVSGAMLSVPLSARETSERIATFITKHRDTDSSAISLAIDNGPSSIVSGSENAIKEFELELRANRLLCMRVPSEHAAHSIVLDPILEEFEQVIRTIPLQEPDIPFVSNVTGTWITAEQVQDPMYWVTHMRETVRFADGIETLKQDKDSVFVEIGPSRDVSVLLNRFFEDEPERVLHTIKHPKQKISDVYFLLTKLARLWGLGAYVDWTNFYGDEQRQRIPLPTYSFDPISYKIQANPFELSQRLTKKTPQLHKKENISKWFYTPQWSSVPLRKEKSNELLAEQRWLVFTNEGGLGTRVAAGLEAVVKSVVVAKAGETFEKLAENCYQLNVREKSHYLKLVSELSKEDKLPTRIAHFLGVTSMEENATLSLSDFQERGFYSLFHFVTSLVGKQTNEQMDIKIISNNVHEILGDETLIPEKATVLATAIVAPQEYSYLNCSHVDIVLPIMGSKQEGKLVEQLIAECCSPSTDKFVAYRGKNRWVQGYVSQTIDNVDDNPSPLRPKGVYLITGGLGGIGLILAEYLVKTVQAKVILTGRSGLLAREEWTKWIGTHGEKDPISQKIRKMQDLEQMGGEVLIFACDVADKDQMQAVIEQAEQIHGPINGVIHAAGVLGGNTFNLMKELLITDCEEQFKSKMYGIRVLSEVLRDKQLDFCLLMSSIASVLGGLGFTAYSAANLYMDYFVQKYNRDALVPWISVNWSDWKYWDETEKDTTVGGSIWELSMLPEEGVQVFQRILASGETWIANSPGDLQVRINQWVHLQSLRHEEEDDNEVALHARPVLLSSYVEPRTKLEKELVEIWQKIFRVNQIGIEDDFFELGGDSLKGITLVSRIHKELHVEIPVAQLFDTPTIETLCSYIHNAERSGYLSIEAAASKEAYVLSSAQKRFYVLHRLHPASTAYNDTATVLLEGELDGKRLEQAFMKLIQRHEVFRTSIQMIDDEPKQCIHDKVDFELTYIEAEETEAPQLVRDFIRAFDLDVAPFLRIGLVKLHETKHILIVDIHHIITDGVSFDIFVRDLMKLYSGEELPELRIQYKDYAEWQNSEREQEVVKKQKEYWMKRFEDQIPLLDLPTDYSRPKVSNFVGDTLAFEINSELTDKIRKLVSQEESTLYIVLVAIYNALLYKYTGQEDIVVGSPIAGRPHADLQNIMGVFVNMLPMRNQPKGESTFKAFLAEVKENSLQAFENQKYQYEDLVLSLGLQGNISRNPLFDVMFVLQNMDTEKLEFNGLHVSPFEFGHQRAQVDLLLRAVEAQDKLEMTIEYSTELFRRETMEKFVQRYIELLEQVTADVQIKLQDISVSHDFKELVLQIDQGDFNF
ncbi:type I polyketide synthase [Brevibacillus laterosporus]|uniref:type I polyketide synthase n=1 Tax=Brevibacillus laterosporus TaxID=1465 RepID=UPI0014444004|nr:type I polyketide synthase [Brevibacillus laterosporus]NKQ19010.1 SDR family NAD(P)-dependent oxidoreductase [Brevibacillus laterosporus]WNX29566.1 type I polyketide synthase [Brevibacillus laterosporus]